MPTQEEGVQQTTQQVTPQQSVEQTHDINVNPQGTQADVTPKPMEVQQDAGEQQTTPQPQETPESVQQEFNQQQQTEADLKNDLYSKGVDFDKLAEEYDQNGELSKASLDALEKAGYPKSVVDAYLNGLQATTDRFVAQVKSFAGGDDGFAALQRFMQTQPNAVIQSFNSLIQGGNLGQIKLAIDGIRAEMVSKYGTANPTVMAQGGAHSTPTGYQTTAEMVKDMSDPRYQTDPVFTREVMRKVQNANFFK